LDLRVDAHQVGIERELAGPRAEDDPPAGHVVELGDAARGDEGVVVVGHRHHPGAEHRVLRVFGGGAEEEIRRRDDLGAVGVVLAHPDPVEAHVVQFGHEAQVLPELQNSVRRL
jgi:hypothetical protein